MAVRSTQCRNRAARSTQGGVTLMEMDCVTCIIFIRFRIPDQVYCNKSQQNNNFLFKTFILGGRKLGNLTSKHTKADVCKNNCTCACDILSFYLLYVNGNAKNGCLCCLTVRSTRGQKMAVSNTQGQKRRYVVAAVRKGGGGVRPIAELLRVLSTIMFSLV